MLIGLLVLIQCLSFFHDVPLMNLSPSTKYDYRITLTIQSREKFGIVGRTSAGKSSLIQTLFRMGTLVHGQITIDDIDSWT